MLIEVSALKALINPLRRAIGGDDDERDSEERQQKRNHIFAREDAAKQTWHGRDFTWLVAT